MASAAEAALQVGQMASRLSITQPVICFATEEWVSGRSREVAVCSTAALVDVLTARPQVLNAGQVRQVAGEMQEKFRAAAAALGPVIPGPRQALEDTPRPIVPPPSRRRAADPDHRRARCGSSAGRSAERERAARERTIRIALLTLVIVALVTAVVFAGDIGDLIARLLT